MPFDPDAFLTAFPRLLAAAPANVGIALLAMALAIPGGLAMTALRTMKVPWISTVIGLLRSLVFGVPALVLILVAYYVLPAAGLNLAPVTAGILAIALSSAFFVSEILRAGLGAIPPGQVEAAAALGLGAGCTWARVVLPQVLRISLPALVNEFTIVFKATALLSVITVTDLMRTAQQIYAVNYHPFETLAAAAVIFVAVSMVASGGGALLERRGMPGPVH